MDTAGRNDLTLAVDLLAKRGRIVALSGISSEPVLPLGKLYTRDGSVIGFAISNATVDELSGAACHINELLEGGALPQLEIRTLPLAGAWDAHAALEEGAAGGARFVLVP